MPIVSGFKDKEENNPIKSIKLEKGTRRGTLKLIVDGKTTDNISVRGGIPSSGNTSVETSSDIPYIPSGNFNSNSVSLASGTDFGTMKLTVKGVNNDNIPIQGVSKIVRKDQSSVINGTLTATNFILGSDIRIKEIEDNIDLTIEQIADAPSILFHYIADKEKEQHGGTIAQYWENITPWAVKENSMGIKGVSYSELAVVAVIQCAREIRRLKEEIAKLKK